MSSKQPTLHGYPLKVGDRVWHLRFGWSRVTQIFSDNEFFIESEEDEIERGRYDEDGKVSFTDQSPVVFWQPVEITPPPKPEPEIDWSKVPEDTPVEVSLGTSDWKKARFVKETFITGGCFRYLVYIPDVEGPVFRVSPEIRLASGVEVKKEWLK